jgi:hypothetical protein
MNIKELKILMIINKYLFQKKYIEVRAKIKILIKIVLLVQLIVNHNKKVNLLYKLLQIVKVI